MVPVGTVFYVRVTTESNGRLDYPVPDPGTAAVARTDLRGPIVQYQARSPGTVYLVAHRTFFCEGIDPYRGSCPVLEVIVTGD